MSKQFTYEQLDEILEDMSYLRSYHLIKEPEIKKEARAQFDRIWNKWMKRIERKEQQLKLREKPSM